MDGIIRENLERIESNSNEWRDYRQREADGIVGGFIAMLKHLFDFLQAGRSEYRHGGLWLANEDHYNAMYRNLSLMSDSELKAIEHAAQLLSIAASSEYAQRECEECKLNDHGRER